MKLCSVLRFQIIKILLERFNENLVFSFLNFCELGLERFENN